MVLESIALLGWLGSALVSKENAGEEWGRELDGDVVVFTADFPLTWLVSDRQSSSSKSKVLPPALGRVGNGRGEW